MSLVAAVGGERWERQFTLPSPARRAGPPGLVVTGDTGRARTAKLGGWQCRSVSTCERRSLGTIHRANAERASVDAEGHCHPPNFVPDVTVWFGFDRRRQAARQPFRGRSR